QGIKRRLQLDLRQDGRGPGREPTPGLAVIQRLGRHDVNLRDVLDSGEKPISDLSYQEPQSTKSIRQRVHMAQACENTLRTRSAITDNPGTRGVIPSTSVGWAFVTKESPSP